MYLNQESQKIHFLKQQIQDLNKQTIASSGSMGSINNYGGSVLNSLIDTDDLSNLKKSNYIYKDTN